MGGRREADLAEGPPLAKQRKGKASWLRESTGAYDDQV